MLTMNYSVTLPADYDMTIIRNRVAQRGSLMDNFEYLAFKAFLITENGKNGSQENTYAPFYLWNDDRGMQTFLIGEGFKGLTASFGWLPVHVGITQGIELGNLQNTPAYATQESVFIPPHTDLTRIGHDEQQRYRSIAESGEIFLHVVSFDPSNWKLTHFTLWHQLPNLDFVVTRIKCLTVLHLSKPGLFC